MTAVSPNPLRTLPPLGIDSDIPILPVIAFLLAVIAYFTTIRFWLLKALIDQEDGAAKDANIKSVEKWTGRENDNEFKTNYRYARINLLRTQVRLFAVFEIVMLPSALVCYLWVFHNWMIWSLVASRHPFNSNIYLLR